MALNPYKRNSFKKNTEVEKVLSNQEIIFGLTHKEEFHKKIEETQNRLTGNKGNLSKNMPVIIHSNSTKRFQQPLNKDKQSPFNENNVNIININVNNLIINNNNIENNKNIMNSINLKNNKNKNNNVFCKLGGDIINNKKGVKNDNNINIINKIRNKSQQKQINNNNIHLVSKNNIANKNLSKEKYNSPSLNIQGIIDNLMQATKIKPPGINSNENSSNINNFKVSLFNNNQLVLQKDNQNINNISSKNNININNSENNKEQNKPQINESEMEINFKYWEILLTMELHADNKLGLHSQERKILELIEKEFCSKPIKIKLDIFKNDSLNFCYKKLLKISFVIITYIKFLLIDYNYEMPIKSNVKKMLSNLNENLLILISSQIFINENLTENEFCSNLSKEFIDVYNKIIKMKKIKYNNKNPSVLGNNISKNLDLVIGIVKQFSNNFFKVGFFKSIHSIFFDIFRLIDSYQVEDIANIVINGVLFYIIHSNLSEKNNIATPKIITCGVTNNFSALGLFNTPSPFLPKLTPEQENNIYTLVLDLDETLVHFMYTPSGGTFLIRPYCFQFLELMSKNFETVIFTAAMKEYADSILDLIDPEKKLINFRLYRNHTTISGITFVKDLTKIGRDLNKTIIVDNLADNFKLQQNNGIQIGTWIDDMKDTQLNDLGKILVEIVNKKPQNIRNIIKKLKDDCLKKTRKNINANPFKDIDINKLFK